MADEKRLIDACGLVVKLAKRIGPMIISNRPAADIYKVMLSCIADTPTVDAVEVVRCRDCDWYRKNEGGICVNPKCVKSWYGCRVQQDGFCHFGEKRDGDGNG